MALFQPTNILPDMLAGGASGTVFYDPNDLTADVEISWTVNGNSPLQAYRIDFYKNNAASTATDSTGFQLIVPFDAISADGTETRFSCKVPVSYFVNAADASTGYTGKFKIRQYWASGTYVDQRSASVFRVNGISSVSVGYDTNPGFGGIYNFKAVFTPPSPDNFDTSLVWTRWQINNSGNGKAEQDTGKVWGATDYTWTCRQLEPGYSYQVIFSALSSMGEELRATMTVSFGTNEDFVTIKGAIEAECDPQTKSVAVHVKYADTIHGTSSPNPVFSTYVNQGSGFISLSGGDSVAWDIPVTLSGSRWALAFVGKSTINGPVVTVTQSGGSELGLKEIAGAFYFEPGDNFVGAISNSATIYFFLIPADGADEYTMYCGYFNSNNTWTVYSRTITGIQQTPPRRVEIGGGTGTGTLTCRECRIVYGDMTQLTDCAVNGTALSTVKEPQIIFRYSDLSYVNNGLAVVEYFGPDISAGALYRRKAGNAMEYLAPLSAPSLTTEYFVYDYGVANDTLYEYMVVHQYDSDSTITVHRTGYVNPCWWEWAIIEAVRRADGSYEPYQEFYFSMNVTSGADSNGSSPGVYNNFTPYPIVMRDTVNRHSGTLTGLIGFLDGPGVYMDTIPLRDEIRALSVSKNTLFLRSRKGDLFKIAISGEITTSVEDNSPKQQVTAAIPWVEIGPVDGAIYTAGVRSI